MPAPSPFYPGLLGAAMTPRKPLRRSPAYSAVAQSFGRPAQRPSAAAAKPPAAFSAPPVTAPVPAALPQTSMVPGGGVTPVAAALGGGKTPDVPFSDTPALLSFLQSVGFRKYDDDNPRGPMGWWAASGRGTDAWRTGPNAPGFEFMPGPTGFDATDWDKGTIGEAGAWQAFLSKFAPQIPPALAATIQAALAKVA